MEDFLLSAAKESMNTTKPCKNWGTTRTGVQYYKKQDGERRSNNSMHPHARTTEFGMKQQLL